MRTIGAKEHPHGIFDPWLKWPTRIEKMVMLLNVLFFTVMPTFGGPIALLILELLVLIPLAKRMGMEEIAQLLSRVLDRMVSKGKDGE